MNMGSPAEKSSRCAAAANQRISPSATAIIKRAVLNRHARRGNCLRLWLRLESKLPCRTRILSEDADVFQVAIVFREVQAVAHNEFVGNFEANVSYIHRAQAALGLV